MSPELLIAAAGAVVAGVLAVVAWRATTRADAAQRAASRGARAEQR